MEEEKKEEVKEDANQILEQMNISGLRHQMLEESKNQIKSRLSN
jgi:hypothetical protein